jgi:hypothetical protein
MCRKLSTIMKSTGTDEIACPRSLTAHAIGGAFHDREGFLVCAD